MMPEMKLPDATISFDSILYVVALIVAVSGVLVAIVKGWEAYKKISVRDRVKDLEGRMAQVEARLQLGDKRFELQNDDMGAMLATQQALLLHFITGNDHSKLQEELSKLNTYMTQRTNKVLAYAAEHEQLQNGVNNRD
jgi:hypothetical protein